MTSNAPDEPDAQDETVTTFKQRDQWSRGIARDQRLSRMHRHVLGSLALCTRTDKDGKLVIDVTYKEIAKAAGCCKRVAQYAVAAAEVIGIIRKVRHSDGRVSNAFELVTNGVKKDGKAMKKTQQIQCPTVHGFAPSDSSNGASACTVLRTKSKTEESKQESKQEGPKARPPAIDSSPTTPRAREDDAFIQHLIAVFPNHHPIDSAPYGAVMMLQEILKQSRDPAKTRAILLSGIANYQGQEPLHRWLMLWKYPNASFKQPAKPLAANRSTSPERAPRTSVHHRIGRVSSVSYIGRMPSAKEITRVEMAMAEMSLTHDVWPQHDNDSCADIPQAGQRSPPMLRTVSGGG